MLNPSGTKWCTCMHPECQKDCIVPQPFDNFVDMMNYHYQSPHTKDTEIVQQYQVLHERWATVEHKEGDQLPKVKRVGGTINVHACGDILLCVATKDHYDYGLAWIHGIERLVIHRDVLGQLNKATASAMIEMSNIKYADEVSRGEGKEVC